MSVRLLEGDCLEVLQGLDAESVHACVTDPPYDLTTTTERFGKPGSAPAQGALYGRISRGFMGQAWDGTGIAFRPETWAEVLRVLHPGAHLVAFGGSRTYHRMACAIEDAGFEIRDSLMWLYATGFPKSHDVSKAMDRDAGAEREATGELKDPRYRSPATATSGSPMGHLAPNENAPANYARAGQVTLPATPDAQQWAGWGTALKPSFEPIILARKPLRGTVAANVAACGCGALHIDACRIAANDGARAAWNGTNHRAPNDPFRCMAGYDPSQTTTQGRWPANLLLTCCGLTPHDPACPVALLDAQSGESVSIVRASEDRDAPANTWALGRVGITPRGHADSGGASRFFYCAKPDRRERDMGCERLPETTRNRVNPGGLEHDPKWAPVQAKNIHPCCKPLDLMRWLVRLVTPPGGTVIDPFLGSGTTGAAAVTLGFDFIGIEQSAEYLAIARARIAYAAIEPEDDLRQAAAPVLQLDLFSEVAL